MSRTLLDLSHPITPGMQTYPGLPGPQLRTHVSREQSAGRLTGGLSFEILGLDMVANTGTYVDAPRHYWAEGDDIAGLALERLVDVPVTLVVAEGDGAVGAEIWRRPATSPDARCWCCTGWVAALGHRHVRVRRPAPERGGGRRAGRALPRPGRHRRTQHRRRRRPGAPGPRPAARRGNPDRRAPHRARAARRPGRPARRCCRRRSPIWAPSRCVRSRRSSRAIGPRGRTGCGTARRSGRPAASSSSWVPRSTIRPSSTTRIASAARIVDSRWAITSAVRPASASPSASWTAASEVGVEVRRWPRRGSRRAAGPAAAGRW